MAQRSDGSNVAHADALNQWAAVAYDELKSVARTYNATITYADLRTRLYATTGISTDMLMQNWIGQVLELAAERAAVAQEPPLTSLCVRGDGTIGEGYVRAPRFASDSTTTDVEHLAAEDRLLCYRFFGAPMTGGDGVPTLTPEVQLKRRSSGSAAGSAEWLAELIAAGNLSVHDRVPFRTHLEVAKLFGRDYKGHQSATIRLDGSTEVWFPRMYSNEDWHNDLSADGNVITMRHVAGGQYGTVMETGQIREYVITFGHVKPNSGPKYYTFLGVFEGAPHLSDKNRWVHQRVADTITFDGEGGFNFDSARTRPVQDDQTAEAADVDPQLVIALQAQIEAGQYAVEDQRGLVKLRGSSQAVFAKMVKDNYGWTCAVTGISTRAFLVASHIVPWSEDDQLRLDPTNGICLSTFVDRAFDAGFVAITPEGRTKVRWERVDRDPILKHELSRIDDVQLSVPAAFPPDPAKLARRLTYDE